MIGSRDQSKIVRYRHIWRLLAPAHNGTYALPGTLDAAALIASLLCVSALPRSGSQFHLRADFRFVYA